MTLIKLKSSDNQVNYLLFKHADYDSGIINFKY